MSLRIEESRVQGQNRHGVSIGLGALVIYTAGLTEVTGYFHNSQSAGGENYLNQIISSSLSRHDTTAMRPRSKPQ